MGDGTFTPKLRREDFREVDKDRFRPDGMWWYPEMDPVLRLGCAWEKDDDMAPPEKIAEAIQIREEDVEHDA